MRILAILLGGFFMAEAFMLLPRKDTRSGPDTFRGAKPTRIPLHLQAQNKDGESNKKGYQFGDLTRGILNRSTDRIREVTGKDKYEFGDLSRFLDQTAKDRVSSITGKGTYEFGDLTRMADKIAKEKMANYTGKAEYQVGDLSKEVVRRTWEGEYQAEDVWLALRILISQGIGITAFARLMPIKVLLELINVGLAQEVGGKLLEGVATTVDERMKEAFTGNPKYQLGDATKDKLEKGLTTFTGKESYEFGDLSRKIASLKSSTDKTPKTLSLLGSRSSATDELTLWDKKLYGK